LNYQERRDRRYKSWLAVAGIGLAVVGAAAWAGPALVRRHLVAQLGSTERGVRLRALQELTARRERAAVDAVIHVLGHDPDPDVREAAGYCLYKLGDARGIEPLRQAVEQVPDGPIRAKMITYWAKLQGPAATKTLAEWCRSGQPWRAIGAAMGLLELGEPAAAETLFRFAAQGPAGQRQFVAERLRRIAVPMMEMIGEYIDLTTPDRTGLSARQLEALRAWWRKRATRKLLNDLLAWRRAKAGKWREIERLLHARDEACQLLGVD